MHPTVDVGDARHGHDPRAGRGEQRVEHPAGVGEVPEVVGAELELEAVGGGGLRGGIMTPALLTSRSIRGEPLSGLLGRPLDGGEVAEVEVEHLDPTRR